MSHDWSELFPRAGALAAGALLASLLFGAGSALAQEGAIGGRVVDTETLEPVTGAQVFVPGTPIGVITDDQGRYRLEGVPVGEATVRVQLIGYRQAEQTVTVQRGQITTLDFQLQATALKLDDIVVTALGISRDKRSLGYTVEELNAEEVSEVPAGNFVSNLQGKVAGAVIKSSPYPGGSTRIVLRGHNSLTGNNEPLFVVDGVPVDNAAGGHASYGGGYDYGNAAGMLDPANIESVSVLKGANAAALYGSRAANGVIIIETKSGRSGQAGISASQTLEVSTPLRLPDYQDRYGQGATACAYTAETGCEGLFQFVDGAGAGVYDYFDESWGPPMDCQPVDQFFGEAQPFCPHPDNVRNFFETGITLRTHAAFNASGQTSHGRIAITYEHADGMAPGNTLEKANVDLKGGLDLTNKLTLEGAANYIRDSGDRRPGVGYDGRNVMQQFVWFGRQVDTELLTDWECTEEKFRCEGNAFWNWNYNYHDNPYFEQFAHHNFDNTDRIIGHVKADYELADWLTAEARSGIDWYRERRQRNYAVGSDPFPDGGFARQLIYRRGHNTTARLSTDPFQLTDDFALTLNAGGNLRIDHNEFDFVSAGQLNVPGIYTTSNAKGIPDTDQTTQKRQVYSLFGDAQLSFREWAFVSATANNDWSSTLPAGARSYFYPSVSTSVVFTDALGIQSDILSFGKIRGSWARVGNDTDPYQLVPTFNLGTRWGGITGYSVPNTLLNANLKPEQTDSWEVGTELGLWSGRASLAYTWYRQTTKDQILPVEVSATTGYTSQVINAGVIRNVGHEVQLDLAPLRRGDFSWDVGLNWGTNDNEVVDLYGDLETLVLAGAWSLTLEARKGEPYGVLYGYEYATTEDGTPILEDQGFGPLPVPDFTKKVLANVNPDWTGGVSNRFRYKDVSLSFLVDVQQGGAFFSTTKWFGLYAGVLEETMNGRENGPCDPGILLEGVTPDGEPISGRICPQAYYENGFYSHGDGIVDASYVKLREARVGYQLPTAWASALGFQNMHIAVIGRNLALFSEADHIDPDFAVNSGNVQGFEHGQFPTPRTIGVTLSVVP